MVRDYKKDILSVDTFLDNRPDMSVHSEQSIQSAIYSAASLLNGETNGNIEVVWTYNKSEERNQNDPRYRNDYELGQIVEAFIVQTQYTLNIGNDFSVGGGSYSIGNINSSFSRPLDRDIIAPGVVRLLQNARVYQAQSYFGVVEQNCNECVDYDVDCITRNIGDMRYVRKEQSNLLSGYIARIDVNGLVDWVRPTEIGVPSDLASQLDSLRLGVSTNKKNIEEAREVIGKIIEAQIEDELKITQNTNDIATLKPKVDKNTNDITRLNNQHASDTTAINNRFGNVEGKVNDIIEKLKEGKFVHIEGDDTSWSSTHSYSIGALVTHNGKIWLSKINDNLGNEPSSTSKQWELFSEVDIDLTKYPTKQEVLAMLDDYVKLSDFETRLKNYYTRDEVNDLLDQKANTSDLDDYVLQEEYDKSQKRQDDRMDDLQKQITAIDTGRVEGVKVATFTIETPIVSHEVVGVDYDELDKRYSQLGQQNTFTKNQNVPGVEFLFNGSRVGKIEANEPSNGDCLKLVAYGPSATGLYYLNANGVQHDHDITNKQYVDSQIAAIPKPDLSTLAKLREENIFEGTNTFSNTVYFRNVAYFNSYANFDNTPRCEQSPQNNSHLTNKQYVDNKSPKRKSFKLNRFTKFYDGGFDKHNNWWGGIWRIPSNTLALPSNTRIISVNFDMSVDYSQPWYRQTMFNWWWDTAGYLVVRVVKIYDSNSDFTYWGDNVTVNIEYCGN